MSKSHLRLGVVALLVFSLTVVLSTPAVAAIVTLGFVNISNNDPGDVTTGIDQLFVDVDDLGAPGGSFVLFTFRNEGPLASSITAVYFDDGVLDSLFGLIDADEGTGGDAGVDFTAPITPNEDLPSGNDAVPPFVTTTGFSADADSPPPANGVNPGESLGVIFELEANKFFADVLDDLQNPEVGPALRIGIHVQAFEGGGSESFINTPPDPPGGGGLIAEPASIAIWSLLGLGALAMSWHRRRPRGAASPIGRPRRPWSPQARKAILKTIGR